MLKSILEICVLNTASVLVACLCFGLLLQRMDLGVFCLLIVQYVFVCISSLYGITYLRTAEGGSADAREYSVWMFACLLVVSAQMSSMACVLL
jgi:hypothetical protein